MTAIDPDWRATYSSLSPRFQARVLAMVAHDATFWPRYSYATCTNDASLSAESLSYSNELLHRITEQLSSLLQRQKGVYSDEDFVATCEHYAGLLHWEERLGDFFKNVHEAYLRHQDVVAAQAK